MARVTTHSQKPKPRQQHDMNQLAYSLGYMIDRMGDFADRLRLPGKKRAGERKSVIPKLVRREQEIKVTGKLVEESFSFGLLLFCIGLCLTLGYLLAMFWAL